jgi:hypothetical protein
MKQTRIVYIQRRDAATLLSELLFEPSHMTKHNPCCMCCQARWPEMCCFQYRKNAIDAIATMPQGIPTTLAKIPMIHPELWCF